MFLMKYFKSANKAKPFLPTDFLKTSYPFKKISNEPLQKSKAVNEASYANKADTTNPEEESYGIAGKKLQSAMRSTPERGLDDKVQTAEGHEPKDSVLLTQAQLSLVERKDASELLLNADPFEEVPGPIVLKKISNVWKYLPEIGCQATVSAMLAFFNFSQKLRAITKLGKAEVRPFDKLFRKYGPIVKLQGPLGADIVLINKPEHVAKVYDQEGKYPVRYLQMLCVASMRAFKRRTGSEEDDSVEKCRAIFRKSCSGPFNLTGSEWEDMRRALQEPLVKSSESYFDAIEEASETFAKRIRAIKNRQNEVSANFMVEVTRWSMECLCHVTLGKSLGFYSADANSSSEPVRLLKALIEATHNICKCESGFQLWRFMNTPSSLGLTQACEVIDSFISKHIRLAQVNLSKKKEEVLRKNKSEESLSFIENLLLNECLSPDEVLTSVVDLLILGVNTTSSALAFTLYHLAQNQRVQRKLYKEVQQFLPEKQSHLQYNHLHDMKYLEACLNESLRLRMPMPTLTRVLPVDITLSNFRIPKSTFIVMDIQSACLKEQNFEKSEKFIPERWLEPNTVQPFSFIPFGHGARSCLGKRLAEVQLKTCISKILRNYQIEYNYGEIQGTKTVISFPDSPLKLTFSERET